MEDITAIRVPKVELPTELRENMIQQLGSVPEPTEVSYNNPAVAESLQDFTANMATWNQVDQSLKTFAHMAVAAQVGCSWCLDINYFLAHQAVPGQPIRLYRTLRQEARPP